MKTVLTTRSPFARSMAMHAALLAAHGMAQAAAQSNTTQADPKNQPERDPPPKPQPQTQRLKMVDDAGLANINRSREERRRINARRFERAQRAEAGKSSDA